MSKRVNAHIVQTENELDKQGQGIINSSKTVLANISEQKAETKSTVAHPKQEINKKQ